MSNFAADILTTIEKRMKAINFKGLKICTVTSISPFIFNCNGIDIGETFNDKVFIHPLFISEKIELDLETLAELQNFEQSTAYNSPEFQATINGGIPNFIKDFYSFYEKWQETYLLSVGDLIAVFELEENTFLVLQKVKKVCTTENESEGTSGV